MHLNISGNQLLDVPTEALNPLALPSIVVLDLSRNAIMQIKPDAFNGTAFQVIEELHLNNLRE